MKSKANVAQTRFFTRQCNEESRAEIDCQEVVTGPNRWLITRIVVPKPFRGQGIGTKLMHEVCAWADGEALELDLEAQPNNLADEWINDWFKSFGFSPTNSGIMKRFPQKEGE